MPTPSPVSVPARPLNFGAQLGRLIFLSRWLQMPLYLGLIVTQCLYVYHFLRELWHLTEKIGHLGETDIMLAVLGLIDVMIANLLIMVIVGGYETFVSRLYLEGHPDQPEWLSHVNAGVLKVKLATALIGISSIHLLKSFIGAEHLSAQTMTAQVVIHLTFIISALALAWTDRIATQHHPVGPGGANGADHPAGDAHEPDRYRDTVVVGGPDR